MLVIRQIRAGFHSASALSTIVFLLIAFAAFLFIKFGGADVVQRPPSSKKPKKDEADTTQQTAAAAMAGTATAPGAHS
jgi:multiple sugar transport system permease protein